MDHLELSAPEALIQVLDEAGVPFVLGLAGGYTGLLFEALYEHSRIRVIPVREESIATVMAEAYGRLTGKPLVVVGQGSWIAANAGRGLLEALLGSAPLVVITDMTESGALSHHAPYQSGSGDYGCWDAQTALRGITKRVMVAGYPAQAVQQTQIALKHSMSGAPGPVAVLLRAASLKGTVRRGGRVPMHATPRYLDVGPPVASDSSLAAVAAAIEEADRPVVLAGNGVRVGQACAALRGFVEEFDLPVATTSGGKGVLPENHFLVAGTVGTYGQRSANTLVADADLVLAVGTRLSPTDTLNETLLDPDQQVIAHIDVEPLNLAWTTPADHTVVGDAADALTRLRALTSKNPTRATAIRRLEHARESVRPVAVEAARDTAPFAASQVIDELQKVWPDDATVTCDAGENRLFMLQWFKPTHPGGYLQPAGSGCMGYAVPAAMGAALVDPSRRSVAVCGDGGFAMSMHGLMTALQERIPIGVVVFNNEALGWVLHAMGERAVGASLAAFDHAAIARAMGCDGVRPRTLEELRTALRACVSPTDVPFVVDVPVTLGSTYRDLETNAR